MGLDDHRGDQALDGLVVREDPDHVGAALDLPVDALERVGRPDLPPVDLGEGAEGEKVLFGVGEHGGDVGELGPQRAHDAVELLPHGHRIRLGEDRLDGGDDHMGRAPLDPGEDVAHEVDVAALAEPRV